MSLAIHALAVCPAAQSDHASLLGTPLTSAYHHLYDEAGMFSRPATVRRGVTRMYAPEYRAPIAGKDVRSTDLASHAVARVLDALPGQAARVSHVMHTQCTLDRQILGSTCLRIQHDHFPNAGSALTLGQLGTAALPTLFALLADHLEGENALCSVSASDLWMAPFYRRIPNLVTYADVGAACLVSAETGRPAIARIKAVRTAYRRMPAEPWSAPSAEISNALLDAVVDCTGALLDDALLAQSSSAMDRTSLLIAGDRYADGFAERVAGRLGLRSVSADPDQQEIHLSSASMLGSLSDLIRHVVDGGQDRDAVVWTASPSGHVGAALVRIHADAQVAPNGWRAAQTQGDASP